MEYKYLEISGRQTGKTHRLIEKVAKDVYKDGSKSDNRYMILTPNHAMVKEIRHKIPRVSVRLGNSFANPEIKHLEMNSARRDVNLTFIGRTRIRLYLDEFDYFKWGEREISFIDGLIAHKRISSIYASTSPKYIREMGKQPPKNNDFLFYLLSLCENKYTSHINQDLDVVKYFKMWGTDVVLTEKYGTFLKLEQLD